VSDGESLGKPVFSDLRQGTLTLPLIYAKESEVGSDILECLSNKTVPDWKIPELRSKLIAGGYVRRAGHVACALLDSARQDLARLPGSPGRASLSYMCDQLVRRVRCASPDVQPSDVRNFSPSGVSTEGIP
jgi:heptaprenyl diphosphate synthase